MSKIPSQYKLEDTKFDQKTDLLRCSKSQNDKRPLRHKNDEHQNQK